MNGPSGANGAQAMFGLSLIFAGVALFWAVVDLLHCTGLSCQLWPMPIGTGVACLCAALGCIVYYAAGEYDFNDAFDAWDSKLEYSVTRHSGFSLALTYVAVLLLAAATALGMLIVRARAFVAVRLYDTFDPQGDRKSMTQEADPKLMGVWSRGLVQ